MLCVPPPVMASRPSRVLAVRDCGWSFSSLHSVCCPALGSPVTLAEGHAVRPPPERASTSQAHEPRVCSESPRPQASAVEKVGPRGPQSTTEPRVHDHSGSWSVLPHVEAATCTGRGPQASYSALAPQGGPSSRLQQERAFCRGGQQGLGKNPWNRLQMT